MGTSPEGVTEILQEYASDARAIEQTLVRITWYMRGGVNIDQAYRMTYRQRKYALRLIEENIERTSKSGIMMH